MKTIVLNKGRERSLLRNHPWIFSGAIASVKGGDPALGEAVDIVSSSGDWLARGCFSPASQLRVRVWSFDPNSSFDQAFFDEKIARALAYRNHLNLSAETNAFRLIHGEADGMPGCVIDQYGDYAVCQFLSAGAELYRKQIVQALLNQRAYKGIYERSDTDARTREGLEARVGLLAGKEPPRLFPVLENGVTYLADLFEGHKTGFYLDQRENRAAMPFCSQGQEVLNCFCYTGGFGLRAAVSGASHVTQVDLSQPALDIAKLNAQQNHLPEETFTYLRADVFAQLRKFRDMAKSFDVVVLDPPKFAETPAQLEKASRGYKDINLLGAKLVRPGGTLLTFSCSGAMTPELFRKIVGDACRDAGRAAVIQKSLTQAKDHPVLLDFPEGRYLTGLQLYLP